MAKQFAIKCEELPCWAPIHTCAQDAVSDYFRSKLDAEIPRQRPIWDKARSSPAAELVSAKRALEVSERELTSKREYQADKRTMMDGEWTTLRNQEIELKENFKKYNTFIKENHEKRERALQKIKEEEVVQKRRDEEINDYKFRVNELEKIKDTMERHVDGYGMYKDFLERVVHECKEFTSVYDILDRYDTLAATRAELARRQEHDLQALEQARRDLMELTEEKSKKLMGLNNALAELWVRYDRTKMQDFQWETIVSRMKSKSSDKSKEVGAVKMTCWNLYQQLCRCRSESVDLRPDQIEEQLLYIQRAILQLRAINKLAKRNIARENASMPSNSLPESSAIIRTADPRIRIKEH